MLAALALAAAFAAAATGPLRRSRLDLVPAVAALAGWALVAAAGPWILDRDSAVAGDGGFAVLIGVGAGAGLAALAIAVLARRFRLPAGWRARLDTRPREAPVAAP